jgi:hypothetical protein
MAARRLIAQTVATSSFACTDTELFAKLLLGTEQYACPRWDLSWRKTLTRLWFFQKCESEARARLDIRKLYEGGKITLKDHASAVGYLRGVWFDHLSDIEIEDFICREIRKLEPSTNQPAE